MTTDKDNFFIRKKFTGGFDLGNKDTKHTNKHSIINT